jgi:hypothetical protein
MPSLFLTTPTRAVIESSEQSRQLRTNTFMAACTKAACAGGGRLVARGCNSADSTI